MILARCPACATTFRVRPEQLRARQGRVRCGHCQHAFNALETLVENPVPPPPASVDGEPLAEAVESPVFVLEEASEALPPPWVEDTPTDEPPRHIEPIGEIPALPDDAPDAADAERDAAHSWPLPDPESDATFNAPPADLDGPSSAPPVRLEPADDADDLPGFSDIEPAPPVEPFSVEPAFILEDLPDAVDDAAAGEAAHHPAPHDDADAPIEHIEPVFIAPADEAAARVDLPSNAAETPAEARVEPVLDSPPDLASRPFTLTADADDAPFVLPAASRADAAAPESSDEEDETSPRGLRQAAWTAAVTFLIVALLAQGVIVFRNRIALAVPSLRPAFENLCDRIGCDMPLPRDASLITIESSDMQPDGSREARFTLFATLRNRADFEQAYPYLEITLTDARDKALVRRVLEPAQWLPADARKGAFAPNQEIAARIVFDAPGVAAAGYQVLAFHP